MGWAEWVSKFSAWYVATVKKNESDKRNQKRWKECCILKRNKTESKEQWVGEPKGRENKKQEKGEIRK